MNLSTVRIGFGSECVRLHILPFCVKVKYSTDKCNPPPSSRKLLFVQYRDSYKKTKPIKMQSYEAQSQWIHLKYDSCT